MTLQADLPLSFTAADFLALHGLGLGATVTLCLVVAVIGSAMFATWASRRI